MSIKNYSNKQKMLLILIIVIIVILIMIIIRNINLNNNNNNNENIQYNSNSLIFKSNNTSESTSDNEVGSESENLNNELENQRYLDSGLVSEFTSIDFIHISINKTNIDKYYRKITDYLEQNNTLALISILDDIVINNENINEGNVIEYYEKNGFTKDFNILDVQFWGVNDSVMVITLENNVSGAKKYIGINAKFYNDRQIFKIYDKDYFEKFGYKLQNENIVAFDQNKLRDSVNNVNENEYNTIKI